jgi:hypothetical protein
MDTLEQERINKAPEQTIAARATAIQGFKDVVADFTVRLVVIE